MLPASLGRHIRMLEDGLGHRLLLRTTRSVSLTPEGRAFVRAARDIVERADRLEARFRDVPQAQSKTLRVGAIDSAAAGLMPQLLPRFRDAMPTVDVEMLEQKTIRLLPRILSGSLDLAIIRPPETRDPRLEFRPLFQETAVVAVPENHPLAARAAIRVADMAGAPLIVPDRRSRPHSHDLTMTLFAQAGLTARVAQIAQEKQTIVSLVGSGVGLAIVPKWASRLAVGGVRFVDLVLPDGKTPRELALYAVWLRDTRNPLRDRFIEILTQDLERLSASG
ncbi:LysR family transcriptional regulator [Cognatishimia sp. F0-27]|nr:LysR family transcriptional regulator [Cognatishimia sp. F0-27]